MYTHQHVDNRGTVGDLFRFQNNVFVLLSCAERFMQRQHGIVGRMVGIVTGRAVFGVQAGANGEEIRNGNGFIVRDEEAVLRARCRTP